MDRIGRVRADDRVAGRGDRHGQVGKTFLGAERRDDLGVRVQLDAVAAVVITGHRLAQALHALGHAVTVGLGLFHRLDQLVDDVRRRRHVRIAHAEIDDVDALCAQLRLDLVDFFEDVGGQAADTVKVAHGVEQSLEQTGWKASYGPSFAVCHPTKCNFLGNLCVDWKICAQKPYVSTMALSRSRRSSHCRDMRSRNVRATSSRWRCSDHRRSRPARV